MDDEHTRSLIDRAQAGDAAAVEELLRAHLPALRAFVRLHSDSLLRERESCSDVVQTVCRDVLQNLGRFEYRGAGSFRNWLFTWAQNKLMNRGKFHRAQRRDPAREVRPAGDDGSLLDCYGTFCTPSRAASAREETELIERAFDELPEEYREVIVQARLVGLPHAEIARRSGRTTDAVKSLLRRALLRLAGLLEGQGAPPPASS